MSEPTVGIDVVCASCGYNLRGLSGEWVRCPECGQERSRESIEALRVERTLDAESRAQALKIRLREARITRAETGANLCALSIGGFLLGECLRLADRNSFESILSPVMITSALIWLSGLGVFGWVCGRYPGCVRAFLRHQMFAIPTVLLNIIAIIALCALVFAFFRAAQRPTPCFLVFGVASPFIIWKLKPFANLSRRARAEIEVILRTAADS